MPLVALHNFLTVFVLVNHLTTHSTLSLSFEFPSLAHCCNYLEKCSLSLILTAVLVDVNVVDSFPDFFYYRFAAHRKYVVGWCSWKCKAKYEKFTLLLLKVLHFWINDFVCFQFVPSSHNRCSTPSLGYNDHHNFPYNQQRFHPYWHSVRIFIK